MNPLDAALLHAWQAHVVPRLDSPAGRAELARRVRRFQIPPSRGVPAARPLRSFTLVLRANDRRLPDHNLAGAVDLDADEIERLCAPIHLPPPGVPRLTAAQRLGVGPSALAARVRAGHPVKHQPFPRVSTRTGKYPGDPPRANVYLFAPPPHHLVHPVPDVQAADWGRLNQTLHQRPRSLPRNFPRNLPQSLRLAGDAKRPASPTSNESSRKHSGGGAWSQTLHRTVRQLRPDQPKAQYERFEWQCPDCAQLTQRLYWPFRPLTLPAYLGFDFHQLAPELPPAHVAHLTAQVEHQHLPFTPGFTCRPCLQQQFGGRGLTYESAEFISHNGKGLVSGGKNTWHRFIQRLTMGLLLGHEVPRPTPGIPPV